MVSQIERSKMTETVTLEDYGAIANGVFNCTTAINNAIASGKNISIEGRGTYLTNGGHTMNNNNQSFVGQGRSSHTFMVNNASTPFMTVTATVGVTLGNFSVDRSSTATSGGDGIRIPNQIELTKLHDIFINRQFVGLAVGPTSEGLIDRVVATNCRSHGITLSGTSAYPTLQWILDTVGAGTCLGDGIRASSLSAASGSSTSVGTWRNCYTFANVGYGVSFLGSSTRPMHGVRLSNCFFGEDGNTEVYLDTYGGQHVLNGVFVELCGIGPTGPGRTTPASNVGSGCQVTANNTDVMFTGCHANGNALDGYITQATTNMFTGCKATNNGQASTAGRRSGIYALGGRTTINGGVFGNTGGASQQFGINVNDPTITTIVGADLTNNSLGTTFPALQNNMVACLPQANTNHLYGGLVLSNATGGNTGAGTMNTSAGIFKNNSAYSNP